MSPRWSPTLNCVCVLIVKFFGDFKDKKSSVWLVWHSTPVDSIILVRQDSPRCVRRCAVVRCSRYVFGCARLSPWSAVLHPVHGGPCGPGCQVRRVSSRLCGRHTAVPALLSRRNGVIRRSTRALRPWHRPLDVRQQTEARPIASETLAWWQVVHVGLECAAEFGHNNRLWVERWCLKQFGLLQVGVECVDTRSTA